jgi:hypothetical protein
MGALGVFRVGVLTEAGAAFIATAGAGFDSTLGVVMTGSAEGWVTFGERV